MLEKGEEMCQMAKPHKADHPGNVAGRDSVTQVPRLVCTPGQGLHGGATVENIGYATSLSPEAPPAPCARCVPHTRAPPVLVTIPPAPARLSPQQAACFQCALCIGFSLSFCSRRECIISASRLHQHRASLASGHSGTGLWATHSSPMASNSDPVV